MALNELMHGCALDLLYLLFIRTTSFEQPEPRLVRGPFDWRSPANMLFESRFYFRVAVYFGTLI